MSETPRGYTTDRDTGDERTAPPTVAPISHDLARLDQAERERDAARASCHAREMAEAEAMALVLSHEAVIERLNARIAAAEGEVLRLSTWRTLATEDRERQLNALVEMYRNAHGREVMAVEAIERERDEARVALAASEAGAAVLRAALVDYVKHESYALYPSYVLDDEGIAEFRTRVAHLTNGRAALAMGSAGLDSGHATLAVLRAAVACQQARQRVSTSVVDGGGLIDAHREDVLAVERLCAAVNSLPEPLRVALGNKA